MKLNENVEIYLGDCLEIMKDISDKSIDLILCDLPYGTTACKWDVVIPFDLLWKQYSRIIKDNTAIVLFGSEPFSSILRTSNLKIYKYDWVWIKNTSTGPMLAKKQPMRKYENISVFYKKQCVYNPQMEKRTEEELKRFSYKSIKRRGCVVDGRDWSKTPNRFDNVYKYPNNVLIFNVPNRSKERLHPTQKPVDLLEYLIKTYTNENDLVLDNCMGSGSTGVACINTNRKFIGIEKDEEYFNIAKERLEKSLNSVQNT